LILFCRFILDVLPFFFFTCPWQQTVTDQPSIYCHHKVVCGWEKMALMMELG